MQMCLSLFIYLINHTAIMNAMSCKIYFLKCTTTRFQLNIKIKRKTILILQHLQTQQRAHLLTIVLTLKTDTCRLAADSITTEFQNNTEKQILTRVSPLAKVQKRTQNF